VVPASDTVPFPPKTTPNPPINGDSLAFRKSTPQSDRLSVTDRDRENDKQKNSELFCLSPLIATILCMQIENVDINLHPTFSDLTSCFGAKGLQKFRENSPDHGIFINRNDPNMKHLYRMESCVNCINFTEIEQGSCPTGAT